MFADKNEFVGVCIGGTLVLTVLALLGIGLWSLLDYNFVITASLVVIYGLGQMIYTYSKNRKANIHALWFVFWFENQWYKLVLLLTSMRAFILWA